VGYKTIVMGTDGSPTATAAQRAAHVLAKRFRSRLVLVSAYTPPKMNRQLAERALRYAQDAARRAGVETAVVLEEAEPGDLILAVAERERADLVVVGNKGMGQASRFRLGSVPDRVAHGSPCDLLIVDTTRSPRARADRRYRTIMAGTDGSPTAGEAARKAMELGMILRAEIRLIFVGDPLVGAIKLEQATEIAPEGVKVTPLIVAAGDPAERITQAAVAEDIDLIVVGNKGLSGARRYLLGSVPNQVAHDAPTDVLIVKTTDRTAEDLAPDTGAVVNAGGEQLAVYRDPQGDFQALSPKCTHMGCVVDWNQTDRTWDCPCHGSRYGLDGSVLRGPAERPLPQRDVRG
jgi:nucleotide-binding universal stress UspA family protein/nitrite reductase/ring-hydroxylating ferredoxin subunit